MIANYDLPPGQWSAGSEYVVRWCPNPQCGKKNKLYFNVRKGKGVCFACHMVVGSWRVFAKLFGTVAPALEIEVSRDFCILDHPSCWYLNAWDAPLGREYLAGRGVSEAQARSSQFYWVEEEQSLAILTDPINPDELPVPLARKIAPKDGSWMGRYDNSLTQHGFGIQWIGSDVRTVVCFEGIFDLLAGNWEGKAVSLYGSSMSVEWLCWFSQNKIRPVLWMDPDKAGDDAVKKMTQQLYYWEIPHRVCPIRIHPKDLRDWDQPDFRNVHAEIHRIREELATC